MEDYMKEFEKELKQFEQDYLNQIANKIKKIWSQTVQSEVYDRFEPQWYQRTDQLKDMVKAEIKGDILYVYADTENMNYYSYGRRDQPVNPEAIVHFVDVGHDTSAPFEGGYDNFNHYAPRHFIQVFGEKVQKEFPDLKVEIVRDTPSNVYL